MMDSRVRLQTSFSLQKPDRPPILGGWLAAPNHVQTLTGCSEQQYYDDPYHWGITAEHILGSDAVLDMFMPVSRGEYRIVDHNTIDERARYNIELMLEEIRKKPDVDEIKANFDEENEYAKFTDELKKHQSDCGDIIWCPAYWDIIPIALWYGTYGYETAFSCLALYPDQYRKLIRTSAETARQKAILLTRAVQEGLHPGAVLTGEDICSQRGPMVSPGFLRKEYWPLVEYAWEPLKAGGVKIVWHCDGNVRPLLSEVLACGADGLQGFQRECGMDLEWIVDLRTRKGSPLLIFGPMEVVTKFRKGSPEDIRQEVRHSMELCRDKASLVFFTSNTITPDIPLENILTYWQTVRESSW
jgi:hypothetical protein